ncbi:MAG: DNA polymerase I [Corallococcus sp.]|nr:DNA polymerase I [Corallococcus sp.]
MEQKLVLIDGNSILNRAYFALPPLNDVNGRNVNAVYGFVNILLKVLSDYNPTHLVVTFDKRGYNFRKDIYSEYKANRKGMPDDLAAQMPILHELLCDMKVCIVEKEGVEADDLIGTLCNKFNIASLIVSGDRDLLQLVSKNVTVLLTKKGITEVEFVDMTELKNHYGWIPSQVVEFKALRGDTSDNIPGVRGIGDKTANTLLAKYGNIDMLYQNIDNEKGALREKLIADKEMAYISKKLATIVTDVDVDCQLEQCTLPIFDETVKSAMQSLQFRSIISRINFSESDKAHPVAERAENIEVSTMSELTQMVGLLSKGNVLAICCESNRIYLSSSEKKQYTVKLSDSFLDELTAATVYSALLPLFEGNISKIVFDAKALQHALSKINLSVNSVKYDLSLMQYLTEYRSCKNLDELLSAYGLKDKAAGMVYLYSSLNDKLIDLQIDGLYYDIELPLSDLLYRMETEGVKVDIETLDKLSVDFKKQIEQLSQEIYVIAGEKFNISSPKQLSVVLFEKLGLKHFKKTSTGYSTNNEVLDKLKDEHPIINKIIQYRQISKLYGTYIEGLRPLIRKGLVHTTYNQYLTTTGRLSSSDPNLQNIPVRNEQGKEIRKLFVSKHGTFVGADYSQIELRLLAAFSKDENLLSAFAEGKDIHAKVAAELMGIPEEMVNSHMRRMAKAVNFGIIYGISSFGLSENTGISVKKAQDYINLYFTRFPKIKAYLDECVTRAKETGYVTTITGRRRYIPEINSSNYNLRSFGERAAMNMPLQGSAADIMKIAMLKVDAAMKKSKLKSKIVLQIHDEIVVDTYVEETEAVKSILSSEMENAVDVGCRLVAELEEGINLYEA